jgi:SNF2 family DNA or RNA helicase
MNSLYPFQQAGVEFLKRTPKALLADEMGLGKTVQAAALLKELKPSRVLVICPASVMSCWERELSTWYPEVRVLALRGSVKERAAALKGSLASSEPIVVIINYEVVHKMAELSGVSWEALIVDESHRVKNRKAKVTRAVSLLAKQVPRTILLTGTPILNRPDDLWSQLNILYPDRYRSYWRFVETYCRLRYNGFGWEVRGPRDPEKLWKEISPFTLRREKSQVLRDLPPKVTQQIWVDLEGEQLELYQQMKNELIARLELGEVAAFSAVVQLLRLRQICVEPSVMFSDPAPLSGAKAQALEDILEGGVQKVVIFTQWSRVVRAVSKFLEKKGISHVCLTGETPQSERARIIEGFQNSPIGAFVSTIGAGGVGITLTAADTVVFLDKEWTPALNQQAVDRLHRIGQRSTVWIYEILARGTVEEYVERLLAQKCEWSESILAQEILTSRGF